MKKITLKKKVLNDKSFSVTLYREEECGGTIDPLCACIDGQCGNQNCGNNYFVCGNHC